MVKFAQLNLWVSKMLNLRQSDESENVIGIKVAASSKENRSGKTRPHFLGQKSGFLQKCKKKSEARCIPPQVELALVQLWHQGPVS